MTLEYLVNLAGQEPIAWPSLADAVTFCRLAWPDSDAAGHRWIVPHNAAPHRPICSADGRHLATITQRYRPTAAAGFFDAPESVADQKRRLAAEKDAAKRRADLARLNDLAAAPIVGRPIDTTRDMFAPNLFTR